MAFNAEKNINDGINKSDRINQNIFEPRKPNACNACDYGNKFKPGCLLEFINKLLKNFVRAQMMWLNFKNSSSYLINKKAPDNGAFFIYNIENFYSASATTSVTSGIILFIIPSMPAFNVIIEDGQPLQLPCNIRFTFPSS